MSQIIVPTNEPNIVIRLIWFICLGWWLGGILSGVSWALNITIIGLPAGLWIIDRLPSVITLRTQGQQWRLDESGRAIRDVPQASFLLRAAYFFAIGWWLSGIWLAIAYLALLSIALLPLSFWMYGRIGAVTTLYRS